ncbi:MAG: hypothetical protein ACTTJ9_08320 [Segatella oris]|uniref:hypothetical protein n=1 Tax=Segatella oris TaxID=28135 RepID=UPI003FA1B4C6
MSLCLFSYVSRCRKWQLACHGQRYDFLLTLSIFSKIIYLMGLNNGEFEKKDVMKICKIEKIAYLCGR